MKLRAEAWLAVLLCGGVEACGATLPATAPDHAPAPARYTANGTLQPGVVPDDTIRAVLYRELKRDRVVSAEQVGVESNGGLVTLSAAVATVLAKERAVAIAHVVRGVRALIDRIDVSPRAREDFQLETVVASILGQDPVTRGRRIAATTRDGVVEMNGEVESYAARDIAVDDVLGIPGVVRVVDDLAVVPRKRNDLRLKSTVSRTLDDDPWIDDANVLVSSTGDGYVTLTGFVGSDAEKVRAEDDARMASPRGLDASLLRVDHLAGATGDGTVRANPQTQRSDRDIGQAVLDAYVADPRVHPFAPDIDVRERVVVLTGVAPNEAAKAAAVDDATNTTGVADVRDDMKLMPSVAERSDDEIRAEVEQALERDGRLRRLHLGIQVQDGRVYLQGRVPSEADRLHAIALATSAPGARNVEDGLVLVPELGVTNEQP